jgi:hypothetical protein
MCHTAHEGIAREALSYMDLAGSQASGFGFQMCFCFMVGNVSTRQTLEHA